MCGGRVAAKSRNSPARRVLSRGNSAGKTVMAGLVVMLAVCVGDVSYQGFHGVEFVYLVRKPT